MSAGSVPSGRPHPRLLRRFTALPTIQTFGGKPVQVYDISRDVTEAPAVNSVGLQTVPADEIFEPGTVFLGMGLPNVYMAHVFGPKAVKVFAAKSLWREPSHVVDSGGRVQSGLFFVATNITAEEVAGIEEEAVAHEETRNVTCLAANLEVLTAAGVSSSIPLTHFVLPHRFLSAFLHESPDAAVRIHGRPLQFAVVKTTRRSLDEFHNDMLSATLAAPLRHLRIALDSTEAQKRRKEIAQRITAENTAHFEALSTCAAASSSASSSDGPSFTLLISETSSFGAFFRKLWGAHVLYKLQVGEHPGYSSRLNELLPSPLKAFDRSHGGVVTTLKQNVLFSEPVVSALRTQLASSFERFEGFTEHHLMQLLSAESDGEPRKYNFVVTSREVIVIATTVAVGFVDWVLSKHVLISGYSPDVRFAGELSKDREGKIHLNSNSGTYCPTPTQLHSAVRLASELFPSLCFLADPKPESQLDAPTQVPAVPGEAPQEDDGRRDFAESSAAIAEEKHTAGNAVPLHFSQEESLEDDIPVLRELLGMEITPLDWVMVSPADAPVEPLFTARGARKVGVLLGKLDPLTTHHEATIESALGAGVFDRLVVVPSDVTPELLHTPLWARQNILHERYRDDPRVVTFFAHSMSSTVWGWVSSIVAALRDHGLSPISVFLWEDYRDPSKHDRLVSSVPGDAYLVLHGSETNPMQIPSADPQTGKPIRTHGFSPPPSSSRVREYLQDHPELYSKEGLLHSRAPELALSPEVRKYIYDTKLYHRRPTSGNLVEGFRNVFGTRVASAMGRGWPLSDDAKAKATAKLVELGIKG